jgi:hypothetical protein
MLQLYREGNIDQKRTGDTVTDEMLLTQRSSSRHHQCHGTHKSRNRDPLYEINFFSDIKTGNYFLHEVNSPKLTGDTVTEKAVTNPEVVA